MENHFRNMFNLPPKGVNSLEEIIRPNTSLLEFTLNMPHKKVANLTVEQQEVKYKQVLDKALRQIPHKDIVYYYERCRDGTTHLHGKVTLIGKFFIEGVVLAFADDATRAIDGRMRREPSKYYYQFMNRYRSPCVCVQYTDEPERAHHWDQYILKCQE